MLKGLIGRGLAAAAIAALGITAAHAQAQPWPNKPIKWINPFPAGGGTDAFARPMATKLTLALGQNVLIENLGGAGGTVGAAQAAKAAPDGYTFFVGAIHHTIAETLYTKLPYNGLEKDFEPITVLAYVPNAVAVHPKHNFKNLAELVSFAKANPNKLNFGSAGNGTSHHLVGELFKMRTGTELTHVPYRGAGPLMQDLLAGVVDMAFDGLGTSGPQIKAGRLRALAVTTPQRNPLLPDVPTMAEAGIPDFSVTTWYAIFAIKGTPKDVQDRMYQEIRKILQNDPEIKKVWENQGATIGGEPPAEFAKFVRSEIDRWSKVVKESGARVDN
jgi:tripartite-type tricarboxylate transporter receptor subunit TctC